MKHVQRISRWLSFVLVLVFFAKPVAAKFDSRETNEHNPSSMAALSAQETSSAPASSQDESAQNIGSELPKTSQRHVTDQFEKAPEIDYAIGMAAYRAKNWSRAIIAFEKVQQASQKFRDVDKRLA
ncbi:MAG: hypothetical protein ACRENG_11470, partial [bacterium]